MTIREPEIPHIVINGVASFVKLKRYAGYNMVKETTDSSPGSSKDKIEIFLRIVTPQTAQR